MELKELTKKTMEIFGLDEIGNLSQALLDACRTNDTAKFQRFEKLVGDLSVDWLQKIFQYYEADRKEKMQDYTPISLARFMARLAGDSDTVIDMCAGSGALTIQKWNLDHQKKFILYEFDENVIPFLIFNMMLRNIGCVIYHADVLQGEIFNVYQINKGTDYGIFKEVNNEHSIDFKSTL